jgi:hypothetical protein
MPYVSLARMVSAACLLSAAAALLAGCGQQDPTTPAGTPGGTGSTTAPGTAPPAQARQVYFDPQDLRTPRTRALLTSRDDVTRFVGWLNQKPRPGMANDQLVRALRGAPVGDQDLLVVSELVGCDSVGRVELRRRGADYTLATLDVTSHQECVRPNTVVAIFSVPRAAGTTINGAAPDTTWK